MRSKHIRSQGNPLWDDTRDRCSLSFSNVFREGGHVPYGCIDQLRSNYGTENISQSENCANVWIFLMLIHHIDLQRTGCVIITTLISWGGDVKIDERWRSTLATTAIKSSHPYIAVLHRSSLLAWGHMVTSYMIPTSIREEVICQGQSNVLVVSMPSLREA